MVVSEELAAEYMKNSEHAFLEQVFKCVKMIFSEIYLKTGQITKTRKGNMISNFTEYFTHFILFRHSANFM